MAKHVIYDGSKQYAFCGNAHDEWHEFFGKVQQFAKDHQEEFVLTLSGDHMEDTEEPEADGFELAVKRPETHRWDVQDWADYVELLHNWPVVWPDGEFGFTSDYDHTGVLMHAWHD